MSLRKIVPLAALSTMALTSTANAEPTVQLEGFADSSLFYVFTPEEVRDGLGLVLGLDQVELDAIVSVSPGLTLRMDLNFFPGSSFDPLDGPANVFDRIIEQGYGEWFVSGADKGFFLRAGKWNAPVGVEMQDPTDMWQYSLGLLFVHTTPANLTGFALGYALESTTIQAWVTNDWDTPSTPKDASVGGRVAQTIGDIGTVGVSATYGAINDDPARLMIDVDALLKFGDLKLGAEFNFGMQDDLSSVGFLLAANYTLSDVVSVTGRFDYLDREILDAPYKGMSITGAGNFLLTEGLNLVAEIRADLPDEGDTIVSGALELTAFF